MQYKNFILDKFQEDAIISIEKNHSVVVSAPTGSGKTLIADYIIDYSRKKNLKVIYTAPIKALSNQKYKEFSSEYGHENVGLLTGDIVKNSQAPILIMTTEIYRNMVLTNDVMIDDVMYVIFDEIHYINDIERGYVWEESVIFSKQHVRFLCLSATIPNAEQFADWIKSIKLHNVDVVRHDKRSVPLHKFFYDGELGKTTLEKIKEIIDIPDYHYVMGRSRHRMPKPKTPSHVELVREIKHQLPCFFFVFSRKKAQDFAFELSKSGIFDTNPEISTYVRKKLEGTTPEINTLKSTQTLRQILPYGIGFHHAGLLPIMKELVEELFALGKIKVLYVTETFAVGINMPAKTVCFESTRKFDGINFRSISSKEFFQIAGRAGRRGIDTEGFVYMMIHRRDFDYKTLKKITHSDTEPIRSQFRLSVNTVLNLIKRHSSEEISKILVMSFNTFQKYGRDFMNAKQDAIYNTFNNIKKRLTKLGYLDAGGSLTEKGEFCSNIYSDEILTGEIFSTDFYKGMDTYQIMLLIATICYESREKTEFFKTYQSHLLNDLWKAVKHDEYLSKERRFNHLEQLTALIHPCYHRRTIFEIMKNTNLLEGDLIRFFRQMIDRIGQVRNATTDRDLIEIMQNCQGLIIDCIKDIDGV